MRVLKFAFAGLLAAALFGMWENRDRVVAAYTSDHQDVDLALGGLDLTTGLGQAGPSPYLIPTAPDTRTVDVGLDLPRPPAEPVALLGGTAVLSGTVFGPEGPQPEAVVLVERHTTSGVATTELVTDELGFWELTDLIGGRYRVRAYVPGLLTSNQSVVSMLSADGARIVDVVIGPPDPRPVIRLIGPDHLTVGFDETIAVTVARRAVDERGVTIQLPDVGLPVGLGGSTATVVRSADVVATDGGGAARFLVQCVQPGASSLSVIVDGVTSAIGLPPCQPEVIPEETEPDQDQASP